MMVFVLAYYFMHRWPQDFAYRAPLSWWVSAAGGGMPLVIALLTISYEAIKAPLVILARNLRVE